jgi:NitT/TauT family transport system substrate-binding protein
MNARVHRIAAVCASLLLVAACGGGSDGGNASSDAADTKPKTLKKIGVVLGFTASPEYGPIFVAIKKGYFKEAGFDVTVTQGGNVEPPVLVASGKSDYVYGSLDDVPISVEKGLALRAVAASRQVNAFGIMTAPGSGIVTPKDLEGKKIALPSAGASRTLFSPFAEANGIDVKKVQIVSVSGRGTVAALLSKDVQGASGASYTNLLRVREEMPQAGFLAYAEHGVATIGSGLVTTVKRIEENPDEVEAFVKAFLRGLDDSLSDPAGAVEATRDFFPDAVSSYSNPVAVVEAVNGMVDKPLGKMSDEVWQRSVDVLVAAGDLKKAEGLDAYYTNKFVE